MELDRGAGGVRKAGVEEAASRRNSVNYAILGNISQSKKSNANRDLRIREAGSFYPARALRGRSWVRHQSGTQALLPVPPSCHAEHYVLHRAENIPSLLIPDISFLGCVLPAEKLLTKVSSEYSHHSIRVGKKQSFS